MDATIVNVDLPAVYSLVSASAGIAIAGLEAQPASEAIAEATSNALIHASQQTICFADLAPLIGLMATLRLPRSSEEEKANAV